jgi:hypothetical protein
MSAPDVINRAGDALSRPPLEAVREWHKREMES